MEGLNLDDAWPNVDPFVPDTVLEILSRNAMEGDRDARIPDQSIEALRQCGYFSSMLPKTLGGAGASLIECAAIQRRIGQVDVGLAVGLNMHLCTVAFISHLRAMGINMFSQIVSDVCTKQLIICSAGSERDLGGAISKSGFMTVKCNDGYLISGKKTPVSLARLGDYMHLQFPDPDNPGGEPLMGILPMKESRVSIETTWDALGARASESNTVSIESLFVPDTAVVHLPEGKFRELSHALAPWYCVPLTAAYLGLVSSVIFEAKRQLTAQKLTSKQASKSSLSSFQSAFGDVVARTLMLDCACMKIAEQESTSESDAAVRSAHALSLKYIAADACRDLVTRAAELIGGAAFGRLSLTAKALRDVHAMPFHLPNRLMSQQMIGRLALGVSSDFDYAG